MEISTSWNTSQVRDMSYMFSSAREFDQDISSWNVSSVESMSSMFSDAVAFDQDISGWNTSKVMDMSWTICFRVPRHFKPSTRVYQTYRDLHLRAPRVLPTVKFAARMIRVNVQFVWMGIF